ncbi:nuclear transport factor 2 family protein [Pedobacter sp. Leaf250]|uniref:nuclear transport factor 2 family protein n=1 Tax=Pedobacter sp. Leaf250 TaxID=2876559 RepID=UPI001E553382|nr:nuclear transport factor 2 family protein [Pedobacter sp. Leaf250]
MYNYLVKKLIRKSFGLVNERRFEELLKSAVPNVRHSFAGDHSLGGTRNDRAAFRAWLERLARVMPKLFIEVDQIIVHNWPGSTFAVVHWTATAILENGDPYLNKGVHFITLKWGKATSIDVYEDTLAVYNGLEKQYNAGIQEAKASQIVS